MIGGGIFAVLGVVAEQAGGGAPLALAVGGVLAALTASSYAVLSVRYPSRGGSVVFVDRVFGVRLATGVLNTLLWFGYVVTVALYATAFGNYGGALITGGSASSWLLHLLVSAAILVPAAINLADAAVVARTETVVVAMKLVILGLVTAAGLASVEWGRVAPDTWPSLPTTVAAGMLVFVAYEGFELIANAGDDVRDPPRNLPRALYLAVGFVIVLYILIGVVTVGSLDPRRIAAAADFALAEAAKPSLGQLGFVLVGVAAVLATFSAINATLYGTARLSYSIALEGELPPDLERRVWSQPVGLLITAGGALVLANSVEVAAISSIASAVFLGVFATVNVAAYRVTAGRRGRRVAAGIGAVACAVAFVVLEVDAARRRPLAVVVLAVMVVLAVAGETLWLRHRRRLRLDDGGPGEGAGRAS
ncbi:MAG: APC family permease [Microthrixaceae bacterium]|nr:APC family permease [Microthrixaceae bacterium]